MHHYSYLFCKRAVTGLTVLLLTAGYLAAQVDLGLTPMRAEFPALPGRPYSSSLTLNNGGTGTSRVRVELLDLYVDDTMTPQFVANAPAESEFSCRTWLSVNPMEVDLGPRSQVPVRFTVRVPTGATPRGYHCAIGFRTLPAISEVSGSSVLTAVRMIAAIYPVVGKPPIQGEVKELKLEQVPGESGISWRAVIVMENSGLMLYRPTGTLDVIDSEGSIIESGKLASFPALPMRRQRYLLPLKTNLGPGRYTLRARVDVGSEVQEASGSAIIDAPGPDNAVPNKP